MIELTKEQKKIHDQVIDWYTSKSKPFLVCAGLAGTGKTTLIGFITNTLKNNFGGYFRIAYVTYTGKASVVLRNKLHNNHNQTDDYIGTIHSLIYRPKLNENKEIIGWSLKDNIDFDLIIIDEASMVDKDIFNDLSIYDIPILAVGDHGQLPPIGDKNSFSLMKKPDLILEEIHRQALENPIIKLSMFVRREGFIPSKIFGKTAAKFDYTNPIAQKILNTYDYKTDSQILCGMNKTRVKLNNHVRSLNNFTRDDPYSEEKIICLKNNKNIDIMNGQMGILKNISIKTDLLLDITVLMDGKNYNINCITHRKAFGEVAYGTVLKETYNQKILNDLEYNNKPFVNLFDFGYAISVHKCITDDTWLITNNGLKQLKEINNLAKVGEFKELDNSNILVHNGMYLEKPSHFYNNGISECKKIKTTFGYGLKASLNHECLVLTDEGVVKKCAAELSTDDYVLIKKNANIFGDRNIKNGKEYSRFLGYMVADGTIGKRSINFSKRYEEVTMDFLKMVNILFKYNGKYKLRKSNDYITYINSIKIVNLCKKIGGIQPHNKFVPKFILETTKENQCEFLKAVFEDGTVSLNSKSGNFDHIELSMKNEYFCDQIRMMLLNIGIISTKRILKNGLSIIYIYGKNALTFKNEIGFISNFKNDRLNNFKKSNKERKSFPFFHKIIRKLIEKYNCGFDKKLQNSLNRRKTTIDNLNYFIKEYYELMNSDRDFQYIVHLSENFYFDKIKSIEDIKAHTYCLTMPETGKFVQNGMVHKNCQGSEFKRIILIEERNMYQTDKDYTKWLYTAITRASEKLVIIDNYY